jgi:hypothetical protein
MTSMTHSPNTTWPHTSPAGATPRRAGWWQGLLPKVRGTEAWRTEAWRNEGWRLEGPDVLEQMQMSDAADRSLLRLVLCVTAATLVLALVCSLLG